MNIEEEFPTIKEVYDSYDNNNAIGDAQMAQGQLPIVSSKSMQDQTIDI